VNHYFPIAGEEETPLRIGKPFNIILSLKDSKGNTTYPEDWVPLTSQIPRIVLVPNKYDTVLIVSAFIKNLLILAVKLNAHVFGQKKS